MANVLLVDDEKVSRLLTADFLIGAGHTVTALDSGREAIALMARQPIDLVVTDLLMPETDGLGLLEHVRAHHADIPVIVITALEKVEPAVRAIRGGAADYLVKPLSPEVLAHSVNRALTQRALLRENEALRRHVALQEAGQRISSTLEREKVLELAGTAFLKLGRADAVALFAIGHEGLMLAHHVGIRPEVLDEVAPRLTARVLDAAAEIDHRGHDVQVPDLPACWETAFLVPAWEGERLLGAALLLFGDAISDDGAAAAPFLARQLALGLKNAGRIAEVEDLVYLDDLTHLFNSRYLNLVLEREFKTADATTKPFTLLFLDLDYFKSVNDTHGHVVGSKLLVEVARVLKNCVRDHDVVSRWGGDEYVILLRASDSGGSMKVAERIRRAIEGHRFLAREGYSLHITTCIGIASYPEHAADQASLLDFADRAMYRGKKGSRNIIYMAAKGLEATPAARHSAVADRRAELPVSSGE